ncbi:transposable element Tcb1 transposase [Trichonephila clavipes]|nr:transposable element Tcb1 transposase [Trichonephila clavipes]
MLEDSCFNVFEPQKTKLPVRLINSRHEHSSTTQRYTPTPLKNRPPRVTTPNDLAVTAKGNRRSTASDLSRQLSSATGITVSRQTVYRHLGLIGLYARRPVRCVPLTATHCHLRLF